MAWVAVHEQVVGMKLRELSKSIGCSQKEALGIIVSLWLWGINNAAKDGELKGSDKNDIKDALSIGLSDGLSPDNIVDCLIDKKWIDLIDGVLYLHDWDIWQEQWYKALDRRAYDTERKRLERKGLKKNEEQKRPLDSPSENPLQPSPSPSPSPIISSLSIKKAGDDEPVDNVDKPDEPSGERDYILIKGKPVDITGKNPEEKRQIIADSMFGK